MTKMLYHRTPLFLHHRFAKTRQQNVFLKMECHQPSGSFKMRGIGTLCQSLVQQGTKGFLSSSGGNAGLAVAHAGLQLQIPTTIVVPETTSSKICERIRNLHARVLQHGSVWDESDRYARAYAQRHQLSYIHPFDDPTIWAGHATLVNELKEQGPKPDAVVCTVGGGGLLCGIVSGLRQNDWTDVPVIAVETLGAASLQAAVKAQQLVSIPAIDSIAKSLGAKKVAKQALLWTQTHPIHCLQVSDEQAIQGCIDLANDFKVLVEPACGAGFAALQTNHSIIQQAKNIVVVVCGGSSVDCETIARWQQETAKKHDD